MDYAEGAPPGEEIPDPYYGSAEGFEHVLDLCEEAARGLVDDIASRAGRGARY
jgi:protein-tyrosine phosphatase